MSFFFAGDEDEFPDNFLSLHGKTAAKMVWAFAYSVLLLSLVIAMGYATAVALVFSGTTELPTEGVPAQACDYLSEVSGRGGDAVAGASGAWVGCVRTTAKKMLRAVRRTACRGIPVFPADRFRSSRIGPSGGTIVSRGAVV